MRLVSVDALRGVTIAAMVLVNNPGTWDAVYSPLRHSPWHGLTLTDLVFPFFLFIVGLAIPLSLDGRSPLFALVRVVRRAVVIFALGLVLNGVPTFDWTTIRVPGVLQRIAVCYLIAAVVYFVTGWRGQSLVATVLLLGYWGAMTLIAVPGHGAGDLGPEGNLAAYVDRLLLGPHRWRAAYDPEGVLSTIPAVATVLFGMLGGRWLLTHHPPRTITLGLLLGGSFGLGLGAEWGNWFPVNKALWTSSYAVLTAGIALLVLAGCYWTIEVCQWRRWARPFVILGENALAVYVLSTLTAQMLTYVRVGDLTLKQLVFQRAFAPWASPVNASLAYAVAYVVGWWSVMALLSRTGIRLRA